MSRVIVHLDADAFFAAVEQAVDPLPVADGAQQRAEPIRLVDQQQVVGLGLQVEAAVISVG